MNIRHYLAKFENKKPPDRISLSFESAIKYDAYSVYIEHPTNTQRYLFIGYTNDKIMTLAWNPDQQQFNLPESLNPDELTPASFSGIYYYKAHQLAFSNLNDITWWRETKFRWRAAKDNAKNSAEKYQYRNQRHQIKNKHDVLSEMISLALDHPANESITLVEIMSAVFGRLWLYHDEKERMKNELLLTLEAFVVNGDLIKTVGKKYTVSGKALLTQSKYLEDKQRYVESTRLQSRMFWATLFSSIAAIASAVAAIMALK